jgi:hypothetical protein
LLLDACLIGLVNQAGMSKVTLLFSSLLCQDVALKRVLSFNFTGTRKLESLFGTGFSFHFWHLSFFYLGFLLTIF